MRAGDPVKRFGRADKARRLAGPSDPPVLLNPPLSASQNPLSCLLGSYPSNELAVTMYRRMLHAPNMCDPIGYRDSFLG